MVPADVRESKAEAPVEAPNKQAPNKEAPKKDSANDTASV
ncbi:Probable low-affinity inorganic phosphate transporter [Mycobacteroides abscessus subsp. abscessus]|nr:Probable low-affinity inorganic phosphate transporter [Mycobacteroides abscessus subsp. abscessus]